MDPDDIDDLVRRVQQGDRDAFHALVLVLQQDLRLFVASRAFSYELIEEIVQAAFVTAYERIGSYEPRGTFASWLKGIARNRLHEELRERARTTPMATDRLQSLLDIAAASAADEVDERAEAELERLRECLAALSPRARTMIERHYAGGVPLKQLAQQFKQTRQAIANALHRIRGTLRACCETGRPA